MHWLRCTAASLALCLAGAAISYADGMSFDQRLTCRQAVEAVYRDHRIRPEGTPPQAASVDDYIIRSALAARVEGDLRKSSALEVLWGRPITGEQLQAEIDRMARETRQAEVLAGLFRALGDDPKMIAECLARPLLADRLARSWYARDERLHGPQRAAIESELLRVGRIAGAPPRLSGRYSRITWIRATGPGGPDDPAEPLPGVRQVDARDWSALILSVGHLFDRTGPGDPEGDRFAPSAARPREPSNDASALARIPVGVLSGIIEHDDRFEVLAVLSKGPGRLVLAVSRWPKTDFDGWWASTGATFSDHPAIPDHAYILPAIAPGSCPGDTWTPTNFMPPTARLDHAAVWTGTEMIVWGGDSGLSEDTGGRYTPATDNWAPLPVTGAPVGRYRHTAVWSGTEMIVWGGVNNDGDAPLLLDDGGRYDPATDAWRPVSLSGAPSPRLRHTAIWTGARMLVWGGYGGSDLGTGALYDPLADAWTTMSTTAAPTPRSLHSAVWTGDRMIVWGGSSGGVPEGTGARYDPGADLWTPLATAGAPAARSGHTAAWTGTEMIVWGGRSGTYENTGGRYDPGTGSWRSTQTDGAPSARRGHTAIWSGAAMIVWGGFSGSFEDTGGRYLPDDDIWITTSGSGAPAPRYLHTAVWTGSEMIVWGGSDGGRIDSGGRYEPVGDSWIPTASSQAPWSRHDHTSLWTGVEMIIWGGARTEFDGAALRSGGRYLPSINAWIPTAVTGAPAVRQAHTAVWTGSEMIVWGGLEPQGAVLFDDGGRYHPASDTWIAPLPSGAPAPRTGHTAVWTGSGMIVWGGLDPQGAVLDSGGLYSSETGAWTPTAADGAPAARSGHTAVWSGSQMLVWGGESADLRLQSGGAYDPVAGTWDAIPLSGAPDARLRHSAVWSGSEMIIWGGSGDSGSGPHPLDSGGRYSPAGASWLPVAPVGAPAPREGHSAVWTGSEMIIWGGSGEAGYENTGGRYLPSGDTWQPTATTGAPSARAGHTALWNDSQMIVWGGLPAGAIGGCYCACSASNATPEAALDLAFSDVATIRWTATPGMAAYNLYRGSVTGGTWSYDHQCDSPRLNGTSVTVESLPAPGSAFYYLVSGIGVCGEGVLGLSPDGPPVPNPVPCP